MGSIRIKIGGKYQNLGMLNLGLVEEVLIEIKAKRRAHRNRTRNHLAPPRASYTESRNDRRAKVGIWLEKQML